jgi:iron complex outermembrane receptor protein
MSNVSFRSNMRSYCRLAAFAGVSVMSLAVAGIAQAQDAEGMTDGEIIVTATRRSESIQDTPISVAVTSGAALDQYGVTSFQDLTRIEPSLVVNNQGVTGNQFIIRGILSDIGATTGFYLDESPLIGGLGVEDNGDGSPGVRLHDVARVEVLKGPQGTLFGSGSMSGTIRVINNKPNLDKIEGGFSTSGATIKSGNPVYEGDAYINVPISPTLAVRAVVWGETGGGYIDHTITTSDGTSSFTKKDVNDRKVYGGRVSALFQPVDDFSLLLSATHQEAKADDTQAWDLGAGAFNSTSPTVEDFSDNYDIVSLTGNYDAGFGSFTAIGTYTNQHTFRAFDSTPTGMGLAGAFGLEPFKTSYANGQKYENYIAEGRFSSKFDGPIQIVTGAYYQRDTTIGHAVAVRADDASGESACYDIPTCTALGLREPGFSAPGVPASDFEYGVDSKRRVKQWAVYGQVDFKPIDKITLTAGIRYFKAKIFNGETTIQDIAGPPDFAVPVPVPSWAANGGITTPYTTQDDHGSEDSPSYAFSALYEATPTLSFFARAASGFRLGGNNGAANLASQSGVPVPRTYKSDKLWSYELGTKIYALDKRVFVDASIYQMDWTNQQLNGTDPSGAFDYTLNGGKSRIRGGELKITYNDPSGLSMGGGVTYTNAKLTRDLDPDVINGGTIGYDGDRLPRIPHWIFAGQVSYDTEVRDNLSVYAQTDFNYRGSSFYSFNDQNFFNPKLKSFFLLGAKIGFRTGPWDLGLFVQNLTNKTAIYGLNANSDGIDTYSAAPRTIGVKLGAKF